MKTLTAVALDDEGSNLEILKSHAEKVPFIDLKKTFLSPSEAISYLQDEPTDVLFLDIEMPDIGGLEFAKMLANYPTKIVLVTAYSEYAIDGYEIQAVDYLLKPVNFDRFLKACSKVQEILINQVLVSDFIFVKDGYQLRKIQLDQIRFIKSDTNLLYIHTLNERVVTRMTMTRMMENLPTNSFYRVHKSFIVNLPHIERVDQQFVYLKNEEIPISSAFRNDFLSAVGKLLKS